MLVTKTKTFCTVWVLIAFLFIVSEACCKKGPEMDLGRCPRSRTETADRGQTKKQISWEDPYATDKKKCKPITYDVEIGKPSRSTFECNGDRNLVRMRAYNRKGKKSEKTCCFSITCTTTKCQSFQVNNGLVSCSHNNIYGSICYVTCLEGFEVFGANRITCERNTDKDVVGEWRPGIPICRPILCDALYPFENGRYHCTRYLYVLSRCCFSCNDGFKLSGDTCIVCLGRFGWTPKKPTCVDAIPPSITCPPPVTKIADGTGIARNVNWNSVWAVDNLEGSVAVEQVEGPDQGSDLTTGFYTIRYRTSDSLSNQAWCSFDLIVKQVFCSPVHGNNRQSVHCTNDFNLDSVCHFQCAIGYYLAGSTSLTCQRDGSSGVWNGERPVCNKVTCPTLSAPENGRFANGITNCPVAYGSWCALECDEGYNIIGSSSRRCIAQPGHTMGTWDGDETQCISVTCPIPYVSSGAFITNRDECRDNTNNPAGTICRYDCQEGHLLVGSPTIYCDNGFWSANAPRCDILRCKSMDLPAPENGYKRWCPKLEEVYGTVCELGCYLGFSPTEVTRVTCLSHPNGTSYWSDTIPVCEATTCPPLDPPDNGNSMTCTLHGQVVSLADQPQRYQTICTTTCDDGFTAKGSHSRICQIDGQWDGVPLNCTDTDGPVLVIPTIPVKYADPLQDHVVVDYSEWETEIIQSAIDVSLPVVLELTMMNGIIVDGPLPTIFLEGIHILGYTCKDQVGNEKTFSLQLVVQANQCSLNELANGYISGCFGQSVDFDTICHFRCFEGYKGEGGRRQETRRCLQDGTWTGNELSCEVVQCPGNLSLGNGMVVPRGVCESASQIPYDTKCVYQCDSGFSLSGPSTSVCQNDGTWSFGNYHCEDIHVPQFTSVCPCYHEEIAEMGLRSKVINFPIPQAKDNSGNVTVTRLRGLAPGSEFSEGYHVTTYRAVDPSGNAVNCDVIVSLTVKRCEVPRAPISGSLVDCSWINGATCGYQCNDGYELAGVSQRRCQLNDDTLPSWDSLPPTCQAIKCPALNVSANVVKSGCNNDEEVFGTVCSLYCPYGFSSSGSSVSRCQADGSWDVNDFRCQERRCPPLEVPDGATVTPLSCQHEPSYGHSCVFGCPQGYRFFPSYLESVFCKADGSWSGEISGGYCRDYQPPHFTNCPMDHTIYLESGDSNVYVNWSLTVTDNSGLIVPPVTCNFDHQRLPIGVYPVTCSASDVEGNSAYCSFDVTVKAYRCPVLFPPPMGQIHGPCVNFFGTTCMIECLPGYVIQGSGSATCERDKLTGVMSWEYDNVAPSCKILTCPPITNAHLGSEFASVYPSVCQHPSGVLPGGKCTLYCNHRFTLLAALTEVTCLSNATWNFDLDNLNLQCIDELSPVIVFCPSDFHVVLTQDSPVAIITFEEPTAIDNSNQPLLIKRNPEDVSSPYVCESDKLVTFTFYDTGNNSVSCTFRVIVEDNLYPVLEFCPMNINIDSQMTKTVVEWSPPRFSELSNDVLDVHCNFHSGDEFSFGTYHVHCVASNPTNSKSTTCSFDISVEPVGCLPLRPPDNGALSCDLWFYGTLCFQSCQSGFDVPRTIPGARLYDGRFSCVFGDWMPPKVFDCSAVTTPRHMKLLNEVQYFSGNCENSATQEQIRRNFINLLQMDEHLDATYCQGNQNCTIENVQVICGNVTSSGGSRKRRSISSSLERQGLLRDSHFYQERRQKILFFQETNRSKFPSRYRRNTVSQYEVKIYFDLLVDITQGSDDDFEEELYAAEASLYGLSDEIARRVETGELVPQVEELNLTVHDNPVVYHYINAVCEAGFSSDPVTLVCGACPTGTFNNEDEDTCDPCPIGFYQNDTEQVSCNSCPVGMSTLDRGSINITECLPICEPGSSSPTGLAPCSLCDIESYQPAMGALECVGCPNGTLCLASGATSVEQCLDQCLPGTYSSSGLIPCTPCAVHSYQPMKGETFCHPCPDGYISSEEGSVYRNSCSIPTGYTLCNSGPCFNGGTCMPGLYTFNCTCRDGYFGLFCEIFSDNCSLICLNDGTCLDSSEGFYCFCADGFTGSDCSVPVDSCLSDPCENNGTCLGEGSGYTCYCPQLYSGVHCETKRNHCDPDPCINGSCVNNLEDRCDCYPGYNGEFCETEVNECSSEPCFNEGTCNDLINGFTCSCSEGFTGGLCEIDVDLCQSQPCPEYSTCVDLNTRYACVCPAGKTGNHCEQDALPCQSYPCQNGATCLNNGSDVIDSVDIGYSCKCVSGFSGVNCQLAINECESQPCSNGGICQDLHNSFMCHCSYGFKGPQCEFLEDPCSSSPCLNEGTCIETNEIGVFRCQCTSNYDGDRCQDRIRWCINTTCMNGGSCSDDQDIRTCDCTSGFRGTYCEIQIESCNPNPCLNDGECIDSGTGDFTCRCASGFNGSHCEERLPFCESSPCQNNGTCVTLQNDSYCACDVLYEGQFCENVKDVCVRNKCVHGHCVQKDVKHYDCICDDGYSGRYCAREIDECMPNPCVHSTACKDLIGGFSCTCKDGWKGEFCDINIDDCIGHSCVNGATCIDGLQTYSCLCPKGFTGLYCEENIDDCHSHSCPNGATCIDGINKFTCKCPRGSTGKWCQVLQSPCMPNPCMHGAICSYFEGQGYFYCLCPGGVEGTRCEINMDDCGSHLCQNGATCVDQVGSYLCVCPTGFNGTYCENTLSPCIAEPCLNGGSCVEQSGSAICYCQDGFVGSRCELNKDDCFPNPCNNGGTCTDGVDQFNCSCVSGFMGDTCELNIDDCMDNACENGATCVDELEKYSCNCLRAYYGDFCQLEFDDDLDFLMRGNHSVIEVIFTETKPVSDFTISFWMSSTPSNDVCIMEYQPALIRNGPSADFKTLSVATSADHLVVNLLGHALHVEEIVNDERWHHIALTWNFNFLNVFIDGRLVASHQLTVNLDGAYIFKQHGKVRIGHTNSNGSDGSLILSRVNIWQSVLEDSLIQDMARNCFQDLQGDILISNDLLSAVDTSVYIISPSQCDAFDDCASSPCSEEATCVDGYHGYTCVCPPYVTGPTCHDDIVDCFENSCENGGTCVDRIGNFTCLCPEDTTGTFCELKMVHGGWGNWSLWTDCSQSCGGGNKSRVRFCSSPAPLNGGLLCEGENMQISECNTQACSVCKQIPTVKNGYFTCNNSEDWDYFCTHHCNEGLVPGVPPLESYHCGESTFYSWNMEDEDNPSLRVPSCVEPVTLSGIKIEYFSSYPELSCTTENYLIVMEEITTATNLMLSRVCNSASQCYLDEVTVKGCNGEEEVTSGSNVTKVISFIIDYFPGLETLSVNESVVGPIIDQLIEDDVEKGGGLISVDGQIYGVDITTISTEGTPLCPNGTYVDTEINLRCAPCESGSYWEDELCFFCPAGSYQPDKGKTFCHECPLSTSSNIGAVSMEECEITGDSL